MDSIVSISCGRGPRGSQDETSPFPLEFMVARPLGSNSQDETAPFPLDFVVVARKRRANQDETSPFPLEYQVTLPESEPSSATRRRPEAPKHLVRGERTRGAPRRARQQSTRVELRQEAPRQEAPRVEASAELRAYAARIAAGEALPPFRGPVVANDARPRTLPAEPHDLGPAPSAVRPVTHVEQAAVRPAANAAPPVSSSRAIAKLALGLALMTAALVAAAVGGDDATLREVGSSIGGWFTGNDGSIQRPPFQSASSPCKEGVDLVPAAARR